MRKIHGESTGTKAKLAMAFHAFQPVFNFQKEVEKAYEFAYEPFLNVLKDFPEIKGTFHFSGNMLEWLVEKKPAYIELMKEMVFRKQIELMGGGFFEPVMAVIPRNDAVGQLEMMSDKLESIFGVRPVGAWTTERVWDRRLADIFHQQRIKYTILDDNHLLSSFSGESGKFRPCVTCGDTCSVTVFPSSSKLRYLIPFGSVGKTMGYMKEVKSERKFLRTYFFFADDLEKFGAWPRTYSHVYRKKWLERFFKRLRDDSQWLETVRYSDITEDAEKEDVGVLRPASYSEMDQWCEGVFSNFMTKYPESGRMHSRMLDVSAMLDEKADAMDSEGKNDILYEARKELFKAQTCCPYWHGTFGGVYLPHLRSGVYTHLIRAERLIDENIPGARPAVFCAERDKGDGSKESVMGNSRIKLFIDPESGGAIKEIDLNIREINPVNVFSRQKERYHRKLAKGYHAIIRKARRSVLRDNFQDIDIHDVLGIGERGLGKMLSYDAYNRGVFITRVVPGKFKWDKFADMGRSPGNLMDGHYSSEISTSGDLITQTFFRRECVPVSKLETLDIGVIKHITLGKEEAFTTIQKVRCFSPGTKVLSVGVEFNFLVWDENVISRKKRTFVSDMVELEDRYSGLKVGLVSDRPVKITTYPVYSINETERGLGKTFQGVCVVAGDVFTLSGESDEAGIEISLYMR